MLIDFGVGRSHQHHREQHTYGANTGAILTHPLSDPTTTLVVVPAKKIKSPDPEKEPDAIPDTSSRSLYHQSSKELL